MYNEQTVARGAVGGSKDPPGRKLCPCLPFTSLHPPSPYSKSSKHAAAMPFGLCVLAIVFNFSLSMCPIYILLILTSSQAPSYARRLQSETMNHLLAHGGKV